jgi:uncharacterized protein (TIGR00369 family)
MKMFDLMRSQPWTDETRPPIAKLLGIVAREIDVGRTVFEMEAQPTMANPLGMLHGGIFCDLADLAMGAAYVSTLEVGESFATLELKINYLKPIWAGPLIASARVVKGGKTIGLVECDVHDAGGSLVARATSTCMTLRGEMAKGR